jgi:hypothetical protein
MTPRSAAIHLAQSSLRLFLTRGITEYSLKWRYSEGRWDVYSLQVDQWHILISDSGRILYAMPYKEPTSA